jgi:hypothetical protein
VLLSSGSSSRNKAKQESGAPVKGPDVSCGGVLWVVEKMDEMPAPTQYLSRPPEIFKNNNRFHNLLSPLSLS